MNVNRKNQFTRERNKLTQQRNAARTSEQWEELEQMEYIEDDEAVNRLVELYNANVTGYNDALRAHNNLIGRK